LGGFGVWFLCNPGRAGGALFGDGDAASVDSAATPVSATSTVPVGPSPTSLAALDGHREFIVPGALGIWLVEFGVGSTCVLVDGCLA
jgi:hypothetical protein